MAEPETALVGLRIKLTVRLIAIGRVAATSAPSAMAKDRMPAS
jgi:hypothetical protein